MSLNESGISWTDGTLNSLYGCWGCSVGCRLCYAVGRVYRHSQNSKVNADGRFSDLVVEVKNEPDDDTKKRFTGAILFDPVHLYAVLNDSEPKRIFVNEFSDLLFASLPTELVIEHFRVFNHAQCHQFQVLTKRSERLASLNASVLDEFWEWPTNVWMGVSVCSAAKIEMERIEHLGATAAEIKWISFEPWVSDVNRPLRESVPGLGDILSRNGISWVVIGGESGPKDDTNLMTLDDARYLMTEAKAAGCRVHFKQLGAALAIQLGVYSTNGDHRAKGGSPDQWPADLNVVEWPDAVTRPHQAPDRFMRRYRTDQWQRFDGE